MVDVLKPTQIICIGKIPPGILLPNEIKLTVIENKFTKGEN